MPILAKHYKGNIRFKLDDIEKEIASEISIEQTFLNVIVRLSSAESFSNSVTATIETNKNEK